MRGGVWVRVPAALLAWRHLLRSLAVSAPRWEGRAPAADPPPRGGASGQAPPLTPGQSGAWPVCPPDELQNRSGPSLLLRQVPGDR